MIYSPSPGAWGEPDKTVRGQNRVGKERDRKRRILDVKEVDWKWVSFYTECVTDHWGNYKLQGVGIGQSSVGYLGAGLKTPLKSCGSLGAETSE